MKILANHLILPQNTVSVKDLIIKEEDKTAEHAQFTIDNTGFTHLKHCKTPSVEKFLEKACDILPATFKKSVKGVSVIIVATQSFENTSPPHSARIQHMLGLPTSVLCFDMVEACNGFVKAMKVADSLLMTGQKALIVTGEINSLTTQNAEISIKVLLADGYTLTLAEREKEEVRALIHTDGGRGNALKMSVNPPLAYMDGLAVFSFTHSEIPRLVKAAGWINREDEGQLFAFHQANGYIVNRIGKQLKLLDQEPTLFNFGEIGNIGGATVSGWLANIGEDAINNHNGKMLHCVGFGTGLSWGIITTTLALTENSVISIDV